MSNIYRDINIETDVLSAIGEVEIFMGIVGDGTVTTDKIVDGAVTNPKIANGAVTENKLSTALRTWKSDTDSAIADTAQEVGSIRVDMDEWVNILSGRITTNTEDIESLETSLDARITANEQDIEHNKTWWGQTSTLASAQNKIVTCSDFVLENGVYVIVDFSQGNTAQRPYMNINSTGLKPISFYNSIQNVYLFKPSTYLFKYSSGLDAYIIVGNVTQENFTSEFKTKLESVETGANKCVITDSQSDRGNLTISGFTLGA